MAKNKKVSLNNTGIVPSYMLDAIEKSKKDQDKKEAAHLEVTEANYVPALCQVRATISEFMMTVNVAQEDIETVRKDPKVKSPNLATKIMPANTETVELPAKLKKLTKKEEIIEEPKANFANNSGHIKKFIDDHNKRNGFEPKSKK